jgi:hypothetical protein
MTGSHVTGRDPVRVREKKYGKIVGEKIVREEKVLDKITGKINTRKKE